MSRTRARPLHRLSRVRSALLIAFAFLAGCSSSSEREPSVFAVRLSVPSFTVAPGDEVSPCYYTSVPEEAASAVVRIESAMTPGSHHLVLFRTDEALAPDGTFGDCDALLAFSSPQDMPQWIYAAQEDVQTFETPDGVGIPLPPGSHVAFSLHYVNASTEPLDVDLHLELFYAKDSVTSAGSFVSYAPDISVLPQAEGFVSGHCELPHDANVFMLTTHSHQFTTSARIDRWAGGVNLERLLLTEDWEHPTVETYSGGDYVTLGADEELAYTCRFQNTLDETLIDGESAVNEEMCMAIGWYFPANGANTYCAGNVSATF